MSNRVNILFSSFPDFSGNPKAFYEFLNKKYKDLQVHNIYINKNFKKSIQDAFKGKLPKYPSLYLYYPSKIDETISLPLLLLASIFLLL